MNNPRILVTGGSGLLGSYLLRWFKKQGYNQLTTTYQHQLSIPADLKEGIEWKYLKLPDIPDAFEVVKDKDWVIHTAALVSYAPGDKYKLLDINKSGTEIVVNACLANEIKHFIYVGSIGALGKETNHVTMDESNVWIQNSYSTPYGLSKYLGELEAWRGAGEGLNVSVILPSVILGSGNWQQSSLQLLDRVANHSPWYPGGQTGYVDVRDVATFIGLLLEKENTGERWIVNAANLSFKEIYRQIADALGLKKKFHEAPKWLARTILLGSSLKSGRLATPDILNQVYGSFSYDSTKSLKLDGFEYRPIEKTIREVVAAFREGVVSKPLSFEK